MPGSYSSSSPVQKTGTASLSPVQKTGSGVNRSGAKKALLWCLAVFALSQVALAAVIDSWLPILRNPPFFCRLNALRERTRAAGGRATTCLVMGTSRVEGAIRPCVIEARLARVLKRPAVVGNWGAGGCSFFSALLNWDRLERRGVRPDLVMVEVLPALLGDGSLAEADENRLPANELDPGDVKLISSYRPDRSWLAWERRAARLAPLYTQRFNLVSLVQPRLLPWERRRYLRPDGLFARPMRPDERRWWLEEARGDYQHRLRRFELAGRACGVLEDLLARLHAARVPAALLVMPEGPVFHSWYPPGVWEKIHSYLLDLSHRRHTPLVNLREWIDSEEEFNDSHHFTGEGSIRFSERFAREVLVPLLREAETPPRSGPGAQG
jgi:hypothetical protein